MVTYDSKFESEDSGSDAETMLKVLSLCVNKTIGIHQLRLVSETQGREDMVVGRAGARGREDYDSYAVTAVQGTDSDGDADNQLPLAKRARRRE